MRCANPSCLGNCTTKSPTSHIGDRCLSVDPYDPTGARISSDHFDEVFPGDRDELDRRHLEEAS